MLEQGLPPGTRAFLVYLDDDGRRQIKPVPRAASVVDLETELISHLNGFLPSNALLEQLRAYCTDRLKQRGVLHDVVLPEDRRMLTLESLWESESITDQLKGHEFELADYWLRGLVLRLGELVQVGMDALDDEDANVEELHVRLYGRKPAQ
ncbi:hypothetical protein [Piscinibacter koreensis]|uniref:Uncharacterized protein n=1 Tax=Piscinibacter koreensis TaxID=2742824 RepID=A0A7Y6NQQ7_9BURK|nr:hypothetical protein [Schlegelella koreensis]NUZ07598.1 hypothetical protein [Schlegelella koreensis]